MEQNAPNRPYEPEVWEIRGPDDTLIGTAFSENAELNAAAKSTAIYGLDSAEFRIIRRERQ